MFSELTAWLLVAIKTHGILAVILGVLIETIIVPLPSPVIVMAAGYILIPQTGIFQIILSALWIALVAGTAQTIGSLLLYLPGYYIGKPFIERYEKYHGVSWKDVTVFQKKFSNGKKEEVTIFFLRALPVMPLSVVSGLAGIMKMNPKRYLISTWLGTIPRDFMLAIMGFFLGEFYSTLAGRIDNAETIMTALLILLVAIYIIGHRTGMIDKVRKMMLR
jgi:membrane protein DedA with SNARE-associated domain